VNHDYCPVYASIDLLQETWVLHIVRSLLRGPHGFNELARAVGGANTTTLSLRLERLESIGVVDKTVESTMPPRTRYELSCAGRELETVIAAIDRWGRTHMREGPRGGTRRTGSAGSVAEANEALARADTA
jgi:DNA-binding HxlR family transcriptional regulator